MTIPSDMAAIRGLQKYLEQEMTELNSVYDEFPNHNEKMVLPCASVITVGTPTLTNLMPYTLKKEVDPDNADNDLVYDVIGQYDARIQLDLWTEYKIQRGRLLDIFDNALNKQQIESDLPSGLSLILSDYYSAIARYDNVGYTYMDSEENSQKDEWRVKVDLLVNYPKIKVKSIPRISEIKIINQISDDKNVGDDNIELEEEIDL
jgi:hypothetical protein